MAKKVFIDPRLLTASLSVGSGGVGKWIAVTTGMLKDECITTAPVNDPGNAVHRGGVVGTYKRSFSSDRRGTRGNFFMRRVTNDAPHAGVVERGRRASDADQFFSWVLHGGIPQWYIHTNRREGQHIMRNAGRKVAHLRGAVWIEGDPGVG